MTTAQINGVWSALATQAERTDRRDPIIPMSLSKLALASFLAVAAGLATFSLLLHMAVSTNSPFVGLAAAAAVLLGCWKMRRHGRTRAFGTTAGAGALCAVVILLMDAAVSLL